LSAQVGQTISYTFLLAGAIGVSRSVCSTRVVSMCVFRECLSEVGELMQSQPAESTAPRTDETSCFISAKKYIHAGM